VQRLYRQQHHAPLPGLLAACHPCLGALGIGQPQACLLRQSPNWLAWYLPLARPQGRHGVPHPWPFLVWLWRQARACGHLYQQQIGSPLLPVFRLSCARRPLPPDVHRPCHLGHRQRWTAEALLAGKCLQAAFHRRCRPMESWREQQRARLLLPRRCLHSHRRVRPLGHQRGGCPGRCRCRRQAQPCGSGPLPVERRRWELARCRWAWLPTSA